MQLSDDQLLSWAGSDSEVIAALAREVIRLREGIRKHQQQTGHGLCWLNDVELWKLLDPEARYPHETLPVRDEFLAQCAKFYESRVTGTPYIEPKPRQTVAESPPRGSSSRA